MPEKTSNPGYLLGLRSLEIETQKPRVLEIEGRLPPELSGTLYRIGPARHEIYGERLGHWFDGDGMVHAIRLGDGPPRYTSRFVQHRAHVEEDAAKRRLYGSFGTPAPGGPLRRFLRRNKRRNPANTHIIDHDGKLLALCEGGRPWRIDPVDLKTLGEEDLGGVLATANTTFSAHPCVDPETSELWNFGAEIGRQPKLHFYRWPLGGAAIRVTSTVLPFPAMIHDFALTRSSMVVVATPMVIPTIPLALALGQSSYGQQLRYRPELGVWVGLIDRENGQAHWHRTDPFISFHIANAYDDNDDVVIDLSTYDDDGFLSIAFEMMQGPIRSETAGRLRRLRVDRGGRTPRQSVLLNRGFEFPRILDSLTCRRHRMIYGLTWDDPKDIPRRPSRYDVERGELSIAPARADEWAGECVPVPKAGAQSEADTWLLSVVLNAATECSELQIFDGDDLPAGPVARVPLPRVMPFGFHGSWVKAKAAAESEA
ncbi:MAG TPA: carotenoid oxygenase family protein [Nannocystis exedens]|nr:carotenoid oxygenase family protein [Nannocystis exedens]